MTPNKKTSMRACIVAGLGLAMSTIASAQVNLLTNGDFENVNSTGSWSFPINGGWTGTTNAITWADQPSGLDGPWLEGENLVNIIASGQGTYAGYIWNSQNSLNKANQTVATTNGVSYTLTGLLGNAEKTSTINNPNGAIAAVFVNGAAVATKQEGEWGTFSHTFTATASTIVSYGFSQNDDGSMFVVVDDFKLVETASIPEPTSTLLVGMGSLALFLRRKRA